MHPLALAAVALSLAPALAQATRLPVSGPAILTRPEAVSERLAVVDARQGVARPATSPQPTGAERASTSTFPTQVTEVNEIDLTISTGDFGPPLTKENARQAKAIEAFLSALLFEQAGDVARALEYYQITLDIIPGNVDLATNIARAHLRRGAPGAAIDILKNAEAAKPGDPRVLLAISDIYWRILRKPTLAVEFAERSQRANPEDPDSLSALHALYLLSGATGKAEALLAASERSHSRNPNFWLQLARLIARPPKSTILPSSYSAADLPPETVERALRLVRKARSLAANDSNALVAAADLLSAFGKTEEAVEAFSEAAANSPGEALPRERLARALLSIGQDEKAVAPLEELARIDPGRAGVFELLAGLYQKKGETEKAAAAYEKSIALSPTDPMTYIKAARLMRDMEKYDRAVKILDSSRTVFPDLPEIDLELAGTLSLAGRHIEALSAARAAVDGAKENKGSLDPQTANYFAGGIAYRAGEFDVAAEFYKAAIEADPANAAGPYNDLGYMWLELGKHIDEAGELIRRAVELEPDNGAYLDSMGWYLYKKGEFQEALAYLLKAEAAAPERDPAERAEFLAVIHDHIGDTHLALGNVAEAIRYWKLAVESDPTKSEIAEKIEREKKRLTSNPPASEAIGPR